MVKYSGVLLIAMSVISIVNCARILVVLPTPAYSHQITYRVIYKELSLRGHNVVVFTPNPLKDSALTNLTEIDMSFLYEQTADVDFESFYKYNRMLLAANIQEGLLKITRDVFSHPQMRQMLNDSKERFDLVIVEWNINPSFSMLSRRFNCPLVGVRSLGLRLEGHDSVGNPTNPSYISVGYGDFQQNFWGRLDNFLLAIMWRLHHHLVVVPKAQQIADEFFPSCTGDVLKVEKNVSLVLTNTHPIITGVRPLVPAIIEVGGVHLGNEQRSMPMDAKQFLDGAKDGAVYFSFGSNIKVSNLDPSILNVIVSALSEIPYKVIWKREDEALQDLPLNVKTWPWLPQEEILGHPNVKAFITHGGLQSFYEAVNNRIPVVGIPLFADQYVNVRQMVKLRIGKRLDIQKLKKRTFVNAVKTVVQNFEYRRNIEKAAAILHDLPMKPLDKAMWWIEYVLRHKGARHLRSPAVDMSWITYLLLDVIAFTVLILIVMIAAVYYALVYCCWLLKRKHVKVKKD